MKKDNSTGDQKAWLRRRGRALLEAAPVVVETHAGYGVLWKRCWSDCLAGVAIDKDSKRAEHLARQRPTWAVYGGDSHRLLAGGIGSHLVANVLDVDPYGDPWPTISAFFSSERRFAPAMIVVVNDGLRQKVQFKGAWHTASLRAIVERRGNDLYARYLECCRELMTTACAPAGYRVQAFSGYYCGHAGQMTHYLASLTRA